MKKTEICSCGAEQPTRKEWIKVTRVRNYKGEDPALQNTKITTRDFEWVPVGRNRLICHCDSCGKKWGTHTGSPCTKIKYFCVSCNKKIKDQSKVNYEIRGNYCAKCNESCDSYKLGNQTAEELEKESKEDWKKTTKTNDQNQINRSI